MGITEKTAASDVLAPPALVAEHWRPELEHRQIPPGTAAPSSSLMCSLSCHLRTVAARITCMLLLAAAGSTGRVRRMHSSTAPILGRGSWCCLACSQAAGKSLPPKGLAGRRWGQPCGRQIETSFCVDGDAAAGPSLETLFSTFWRTAQAAPRRATRLCRTFFRCPIFTICLCVGRERRPPCAQAAACCSTGSRRSPT
jgi:hypothetical protein